MRITLAKHSGYCMGVRKAVLKIIQELQDTDEEIIVFGPLIHNPQTLELLKLRGLKTVETLRNIEGKAIAVRTHGIPVDEYRLIKGKAKRVINLTCPRVARVQSTIKKYSQLGHFTIIIGDRDHAEVIGLMSYASKGCVIVSDMKDLAAIPKMEKYIVVAQTTADRQFFSQVTERLNGDLKSIIIIDTICDSTRNRQEDVIQGIEDGIDTLVVVGGKNSANTKRLALLGEKNGIKTVYIESADDIDENIFIESKEVLLTAGASTPGWIINSVMARLQEISYKQSNYLLYGIMRFLQIAVKTNILSSLGAAAITSLLYILKGIPVDPVSPAVSFLYIMSMYSVNNYLERELFRINNPLKFRIINKMGRSLLLFSLMSIAGALMLAASSGIVILSVIILSSVLGAVYSSGTVKSIVGRSRSRFLFRFYNSRIASSFGWAIITVMMPLYQQNTGLASIAGASMIVFAILFMRQNLNDIIAFQGDLIMGRETLAIVLGVRGIRRLFLFLLAASIPGLLYLSWTESPYYLLFSVNLAYYTGLLYAITRSSLINPLKYEIIVDVNFILIGIILLLSVAFSLKSIHAL